MERSRRHLLVNLEKPGLGLKGVCQSIFSDNLLNRYYLVRTYSDFFKDSLASA